MPQRFYCCLLEHNKFSPLPLQQLNFKIKHMITSLKWWNKNVLGDVTQRFRDAEDRVTAQKVEPLTSQSLEISIRINQHIATPRINSDLLEVIPILVYDYQNNMLNCVPIFEEIRKAVFSLDPLSIAGLYGLTTHFYQNFRDIMGLDIHIAIVAFFKGDQLPQDILENYIFLVTKKYVPTIIKDFRLISLCNVFYRAISKIITAMLSSFLGDIISPNQGDFVKGRLINENVSLSYELMQ